MINWDIWRNGHCYSTVVTGRGATAEQAIATWKEQIAFSSGEQCLQAITRDAEIHATRYVKNRLDFYGTRRGG
ncbi:hypothetical protein [Burkholderia pseudomallei]|uniref:hypothetical protein n=1 Tax=Burkholderia pseudomallei TaxID=28450 RepID=UPI0022D512C4|nr:hypothetical protein [Burkholderia pseudomallei]MDA0561692.1 hypothetical protein [Burkholderia pseudomallei]